MGSTATGTSEVEALIRRDYRRLVRAVALSCGSLPAAEDAVQEACAKAWVRAESGYVFERLEGWIVTVALNHTRTAWRRESSHQDLFSTVPATDPAVPGDGGEARMDLADAVAGLPRRQREVVVLHHLLGYPIAEIASLLDIAPGSVKNALFKGRAALAVVLADREEVTE